jgi:hypothetical protein
MRYAVAAVALAGAVMASEPESTVYLTEVVTLTSCPPEVPDCPATSTVVTSTVIPMTTSTIYDTTTYTVTDCPDTVTHCPADSTTVVTETIAVSTTVCPVEPTETPEVPSETESESPEFTGSFEPSQVPSGSVIPPSSTFITEAPACPTTSVKTIKTSITTVIPTIIYETVEVPCPTSTGGPKSTPSSKPTGTKPGGPIATAGAATFGASAVFAAAAGLFALLA